MSEPTLKQAIAAYRAGRRAEARQMLERILERDRSDEGAWLWLSAVVDSDEERAACLEHVLTVNPSNPAARRGMERLRARRLAEILPAEPAFSTASELDSPQTETSLVPSSQAAEQQAQKPSLTPLIQVVIVLAIGLVAVVVAVVALSSADLSLPDISRVVSGGKSTPTPLVWQPFTPAQGGFTISMPDKPKADVLSTNTAVGVIDLNIFLIEMDDSAYIVSYADYPESLVRNNNTDVMLDGARDGAVANVDGKLLAERRITLQGYPGRELLVEAQSKGVQGLVRARVYLVGRRLYQMLVAGSEAQFSESDAEIFLNSFQLH